MKKLFLFLIVGLLLLPLAASLNFVEARADITTEEIDVTVATYFDTSNVVAPVVQPQNYGASIAFTPPGTTSGYTFAFWIVNGFVSDAYLETAEFTVTSKLDLIAVYYPEDKHAVLFVDSNGKVIDYEYVNNATVVTPPVNLPDKPGYQLAAAESRWALVKGTGNLEGVTSSSVYQLQYVIDTDATFDIAVVDGTGEGEYEYNEIVTVVATLPDFTHWEENGVVVSYDAEYQFSALYDRSLEAKTGGTPEPLVTLSADLEVREGYHTYAGQFYLPEGYTLVEYGFLFKDSTETLTLETPGVTIAKSNTYQPTTNEFMTSFPVEILQSARAYLVVNDGTEILTYYNELDLVEFVEVTGEFKIENNDLFYEVKFILSNGSSFNAYVSIDDQTYIYNEKEVSLEELVTEVEFVPSGNEGFRDGHYYYQYDLRVDGVSVHGDGTAWFDQYQGGAWRDITEYLVPGTTGGVWIHETYTGDYVQVYVNEGGIYYAQTTIVTDLTATVTRNFKVEDGNLYYEVEIYADELLVDTQYVLIDAEFAYVLNTIDDINYQSRVSLAGFITAADLEATGNHGRTYPQPAYYYQYLLTVDGVSVSGNGDAWFDNAHGEWRDISAGLTPGTVGVWLGSEITESYSMVYVKDGAIYYAQTELETRYYITFNVEGSNPVYRGQNAEGTAVAAILDPSEGVFVGWFEDGATEPFDFTQPLTKNVVLYAVFSHRYVSTSEELSDALADETITHVYIDGVLGSTDSYTRYDVTRSIVIQGTDSESSVYGTFVITAEDVTIEGLSIYVQGEAGGNILKSGIHLLVNTVVIENNKFYLGGITLANGITIWPATGETKGYSILNNTFTGFAISNNNWSSSAIVLAENYNTNNRFGFAYASSALNLDELEELALVSENTYIDIQYNYARQDWSVGSQHQFTYINEESFDEEGNILGIIYVLTSDGVERFEKIVVSTTEQAQEALNRTDYNLTLLFQTGSYGVLYLNPRISSSNIKLLPVADAEVELAGFTASADYPYGYNPSIDGLLVSGFTFTGGVYFYISDHPSQTTVGYIKNVTFENNTFTKSDVHSGNPTALYFNDTAGDKLENIRIINNNFVDITETNAGAIRFRYSGTGIEITGNTFENINYNAIAINTEVNGAVIISNNIFSNTGNRAIRFGDIVADANIRIEGNTYETVNNGGQIIESNAVHEHALVIFEDDVDPTRIGPNIAGFIG